MKRYSIMNAQERVIDRVNDLDLAIALIPLDVDKVEKTLYGYRVSGRTRTGARAHYFIVDFGVGI